MTSKHGCFPMNALVLTIMRLCITQARKGGYLD